MKILSLCIDTSQSSAKPDSIEGYSDFLLVGERQGSGRAKEMGTIVAAIFEKYALPQGITITIKIMAAKNK